MSLTRWLTPQVASAISSKVFSSISTGATLSVSGIEGALGAGGAPEAMLRRRANCEAGKSASVWTLTGTPIKEVMQLASLGSV